MGLDIFFVNPSLTDDDGKPTDVAISHDVDFVALTGFHLWRDLNVAKTFTDYDEYGDPVEYSPIPATRNYFAFQAKTYSFELDGLPHGFYTDWSANDLVEQRDALQETLSKQEHPNPEHQSLLDALNHAAEHGYGARASF